MMGVGLLLGLLLLTHSIVWAESENPFGFEDEYPSFGV